jgi:hypothetical protein
MENTIPLISLKISYFNNSKTGSELDSPSIRQQNSCARVSLCATQSTPYRCEDNTNTSILKDETTCSDESVPATRSNGPAGNGTGNDDQLSHESLATVEEITQRNGKVVHILKRDGRLQPLSSKKVRHYMLFKAECTHHATYILTSRASPAHAAPWPPDGRAQCRVRQPRTCRQ